MNKRDFIAVWIVLLTVMFGAFYLLTGYFVNKVMADFVEPVTPQEQVQLEVLPNYGNQTDNHLMVQPSVTPINKEF